MRRSRPTRADQSGPATPLVRTDGASTVSVRSGAVAGSGLPSSPQRSGAVP